MLFLFADLIAVTGGKYTGRDDCITVCGINTDTRTIKKGQVFLALQGESFDGHDFVGTAIELGAIAAIVNYPIAGIPCLVVPDTLQAYQNIAGWWRQKFLGPVIGVTGSAGKTTTKEIIASLLTGYCPPGKSVHKSTANYNNDIGVAKTLLEINPDHHAFVVIEMGMRGPGEIARLATIAQPTIGVITNIGTAHIGRLGSSEAIAAAKCELLSQLPASGIAILNGEDILLGKFAKQVWQGKTLTYGITQGDLQGQLLAGVMEINGLTWQLPLIGRHNALNFLAGLAVLTALGLPLEEAAHRLANKQLSLQLPEGRAHCHILADHVQILDESYNASPEAMNAALEMLAALPNRRWAVLGAMKELGEHSALLHTAIGKKIASLGIECVIVLCDGEAELILDGCRSVTPLITQCFACQNQEEMCQILLKNVQKDDVLLFKASRSVGLDNLVKSFVAKWHSKPEQG